MTSQTATNKLEELSKLIKSSGTIEFNPHKAVYEHAYEYYHDRGIEPDEIGEIDWGRDIWEAHIYPRTPIGFIQGISNDLDELLDWAIEGARDY